MSLKWEKKALNPTRLIRTFLNVKSALYEVYGLYSVIRVKLIDYTSSQDKASLQSRDFLLLAK